MPFNDFATRLRRRGRVFAATLVALPLAATSLPAQFIFPRGEDASTVPSGFARLRVLPTWNRAFDRWSLRDGDRRLVPIGSEFASDSLGVRQFRALDSAQSLIRDLSGDQGFRLNLGKSTSAASVRTVGVPIALEYGLTNRLTIGVSVPIVQTRTRFTYTLNNEYPRDTLLFRANSGMNPRTKSEQNEDVALRLDAIALQLDQRIRDCASSTDPSCELVRQQQQQIAILAQRAEDAAAQVRLLYGVPAQAFPGQLVVPREGSAAQLAIIANLNKIASDASAYLGTVTLEAERLGAAAGFAGQRLLDSLILPRVDSITEVSRFGIGDIEVGAKLQVLNTQRADTAKRLGVRVAVAGLVRLGTGTVALDSPFGLGTGDGQMDIEGAAFVDANFSARLGATVNARFTHQLGETNGRLPTESGEVADVLDPIVATATLGNILVLEAIPRYRVTNALSIDGYFTLAATGGTTFRPIVPPESSEPALPVTTDATTIQQLGIGVSYSTLDQWMRRRARLPLDLLVSYNATVASSGGPVLKTSQMQIQLRLYQQLFGHRPRGAAATR